LSTALDDRRAVDCCTALNSTLDSEDIDATAENATSLFITRKPNTAREILVTHIQENTMLKTSNDWHAKPHDCADYTVQMECMVLPAR